MVLNMATGGEQDQSSELSCSICFEQYRLPKILQCSHVYCHLCLRSLASDKDSGFDCPICRQTVHVTAEGIDALPTYPYQEMSREKMIPASSSARPDPCDGGVKQNLSFASKNPSRESACDESFAINSCMKRQPFPESQPENINFTKNSRTVLQSLTLTADNKLWVKYLPPNNIHPFLSIYDCKGKLKDRWMENSVEGTDLVCLGDCLLSPRTWRWISPDGKSGSLGYPPSSWVLCSKSLPPHVVLHSSVSVSDSTDLEKVVLSVQCLQQKSTDPMIVTMSPAITEELTFPCDPTSFDISSDGRWMAFVVQKRFEIYHIDCKTVQAFSKISPKQVFENIAFVSLDGTCLLAAMSIRFLLVYDFQDGFVKSSCSHGYIFRLLHPQIVAVHEEGVLLYEEQRGFIKALSLKGLKLCDDCQKEN